MPHMAKPELTETVSFRIDPKTLGKIDRMAEAEMRTRGNQIMVTLNRHLLAIDCATEQIEWLVKRLHEGEAKDPNSPQAEYARGMLHEAKSMLALFCGERVKDRVLDEVRRRTGLTIPHIVPLDPDGNRYGFDSDAG